MKKINLNEKFDGCKYSDHYEIEDRHNWADEEELGVKTLREHLEYCLSLDNRYIDRNREYIKSILEGKVTEVEDDILEFMESVTYEQTDNGEKYSWCDTSGITLTPYALIEQVRKMDEEEHQNATCGNNDADSLPF